MDAMTGLETKVAHGNPTDELMRAFEDFKSTNDERLDDLERRMTSDVVTEDKLTRINKALDELTLKARRPSLGGMAAPEMAQATEHKRAFEDYVRKGDTGLIRDMERKSMSISSSPDGGYLVPPGTEAEIGRLLSRASPLRQICDVRQVSGMVYKKPFSITGAGSGWVAENAPRPETGSPALAEMQFQTMELYAMPAATQALLDDTVVNLDQWIAQEIQTVFAEQESLAFISGNGISKPRGFLDYPKIAETSWAWGNLGYVKTGLAGAFAVTAGADVLTDVIYALKAGYRQNANWVMNRKTQAAIRKLKDSTGSYLWQPAATADGKATLFNFPIVEAEDMPDIATDSYAAAFGDFGRGYLIVDRVGVRILRDPYSSKPYVLFYTTKRVGGGVQNFEAIKLLKFGVA